MSILFIGKRFYTNRDAYTEKFGRIYQLPYYWSKETKTHLWLVDYHSKEKIKDQHEALKITSTPIFSFIFIIHVIKTLFVDRPKTIVASGDCYIGLLSFILAKICRAKFIFDVYDKYDAFTGYRNLGFKNLLDLLIKKADLCIFASAKFALHKKLNPLTIIIPNGINLEYFKILNKTEARKKLKIEEDNNIIGYFGSIEIERGITDLIEAIETYNNANTSKLILLIAGKNSHNINLDFKFIWYLGNLTFKDIPTTLSACDLLALPYRHSNQIDYGTSCKIIEYIYSKKPIVATHSSNILEDFPKYIDILPKEYLANCHDPLSLKDIIEKQLKYPIILTEAPEMQWKNLALRALNRINSI